MKKLYLLSFFLLINACQNPDNQNVIDAKLLFSKDVDSLKSYAQNNLLPLAQKSNSEDSLKIAFLKTRQLYKKIEPLAEYFFPSTAKLLNGAPLDEVELTDNVVHEPSGLQVIEEYLYPFDSSNRKELVREIRKMNRDLLIIQNQWEVLTMTDAHIFDALRLETFRIITLGITGYDVPLAKTSLAEARISLLSIHEYLSIYQNDSPDFVALENLLKNAQFYLLQHSDFEDFNRLAFITKFANPLGIKLLAYQRRLNISPFKELRALNPDAENLFAENVFNPNFYTSNSDVHLIQERVELGKALFFDPILSKNNQRACASCHQPDKAFTDGLAKAPTLSGKGFLKRNVPTLMNVGLQAKQFYDLRADNLENQSLDVINNKDEMHGSLKETSVKLKVDKNYVSLFKKAFPKQNEAINERNITNALASYERSLLAFDSRFDRYMRGQKSLLTASEIKGFNLFTGKAKCGTCHFTPLFNGTIPPTFTNTESEVLGVPKTAKNREVDRDLGRYDAYQFDVWKYAFKTPTVRNIALTAPYMHNGVYKTLEEVIDFYNEGGGNGLGFKLPNQTLSKDKLNLTKEEKRDLIAFLKALTDVPRQSLP
jgi:cytochrome c peroxidase